MFRAGKSVTGEAFIGREEYVEQVVNCVREKRNLSIYGMARIGKTSIVKESIRRIEKTETNEQFIELSLTKSKDVGLNLFKTVCKYIEDKLAEENVSEDLKQCLEEAKQAIEDGETSYLPYLELCEAYGTEKECYIWIVIDEMDYAQSSLRNAIQDFRELINNSEYVYTINISRHALGAIFPKDSVGSNYPGIIDEKMSVKAFDERDLQLFKERFQGQIDFEISESLWEKMLYFSGKVPFFLAVTANEIISESIRTAEELEENLPYSYEKEILNYWYQAICEMGMYKDLVSFLKNRTGVSPARNLRAYGLVDREGSFVVEYLAEYILKQGEEALSKEVLEDMKSLIPTIESFERKCEKVIGMSFAIDEATNRKMNMAKKELQAMRTVINCVDTLENLNTFVRYKITDEELNSFKQKLWEIVRLLDEQ